MASGLQSTTEGIPSGPKDSSAIMPGASQRFARTPPFPPRLPSQVHRRTHVSFLIRCQRGHPGVVLPLVISGFRLVYQSYQALWTRLPMFGLPVFAMPQARSDAVAFAFEVVLCNMPLRQVPVTMIVKIRVIIIVAIITSW